jgi:hypothetical protein
MTTDETVKRLSAAELAGDPAAGLHFSPIAPPPGDPR